jgi:hypothetical protein
MGSSGRNPWIERGTRRVVDALQDNSTPPCDVRRGLAYEFNKSSSHIKALWFAHRLELKKYEGGECELPPEGKKRIHDLILRSGSFDRLMHIAGEVSQHEEVWVRAESRYCLRWVMG